MEKTEKKLFLIPYILLSSGLLIVQIERNQPWDFSVFAWVTGFFFSCFLLNQMFIRTHKNGDPYLLPLMVFLTSIGLVMIYRLKEALFFSQLKWTFIGLLIFFLAAMISKKIQSIGHYKYVIGVLAVLLLIATILFGSDIGGSRNWIILGPIRFQPSEFVKLAIIIFLAAYLIEHKCVLSLPEKNKFGFRLPPFRFLAPLLLIWGFALMMFVIQRDLGSALLFFGIAISMTYMATGNLSYVVLAGLFFSISSCFSYFLFAHVRVRVAIWLDPWLDPTGQAYQIIQSLFSFGAGNLFGTGLMLGSPGLIPEVHTDFIFSAIAEELGLLGALAVIFAYLLLLYRGFRISLSAKNEMHMLLAAGLSASLAIQVFIILAGITKLLPLTGITLPLISYGGSSMVATYIMAGLLFSLSIKENNNE